MIVIDAHLDLAWNAIQWNRDLSATIPEMRTSEAGMPGPVFGQSTVSFPAMREGKVAISIATVLGRPRSDGVMLASYRTRESAYAAAHGQMAYYRAMERRGALRWIKDLPTLERHAAAWLHGGSNEPLGIVLSMEGADPILDPGQLGEWWDAGLRLIGLSHYGPGVYAGGTGSEGGLSDDGRKLLKEMRRLGMILDATHLTDLAFDEALDAFDGPVLASHHNCRSLVPRQRQLSDEHIQRLIERNAVIGAAFDAWMLDPAWVQGETEATVVNLETVVNHIDRVCQLAGNARHAAIGTDLDGGFGKPQCPADLDTIADLQRLPALLSKRGYSSADIKGIMYNNWLDLFRRAWG